MSKHLIVEHESSYASAADDGFSSYLRKIRKYPMLSQEEEYECILRWQENRDSHALQKLINSHLRLVAKIASNYMGYGLPYADMISEGSIGIMQAVDRFDSSKGFRFSTYASWWIKAAMKEYILKSWSMVKLGTTAAQKKLFFQLRRLKQEMVQSNEDDNTLPEDFIAQISEELNVSEKDVRMMNERMSGQDYSLNAPIATEEGGEWQDWLEDENDHQEDALVKSNESKVRSELLEYALECLNERELVIFKRRNLEEPTPTLEIIAEEYGLSRERIRQIEARAFEKVQKNVKRKAAEMRVSMF